MKLLTQSQPPSVIPY